MGYKNSFLKIPCRTAIGKRNNKQAPFWGAINPTGSIQVGHIRTWVKYESDIFRVQIKYEWFYSSSVVSNKLNEFRASFMWVIFLLSKSKKNYYSKLSVFNEKNIVIVISENYIENI